MSEQVGIAGEKSVDPKTKALLELGPVAVFFAAFLLLRNRVFTIGGTEYEGFIIATALFVPVIVFCTYLLWRLSGKLSKMQVLTAVLVTVFGGLTVWFNDERFFKVKPTIIYLTFAAILGIGLLQGKSYLRVVMEELLPLQPEGWMILTKRFAGLFFGLAMFNEIVWRSFSTDVWVSVRTFGFPVIILVFVLLQGRLMTTYAVAESRETADTPTGDGSALDTKE